MREGQFVMDSWLEGKVEDSRRTRVVRAKLFGRYDEGDWFRVRPTIIATANLIAARANEIAPSFVREGCDIEVEVLPLGAWSSAESRVRVILREWAGDGRDLKVVGSGTARWVAAAVRLACQQLRQGQRTVTASDGRVVTDPLESNELIRSGAAEPFTQTSLKLVPGSSKPVVYIVDEPEAHLHPLAVRSVIEWLRGLVGTAATVVVTTHHPAFLDTAGTATQLVLVTRSVTGSEDVSTWNG
jgi:AAA domain, putative AbiEii toxin, Type IV TA system